MSNANTLTIYIPSLASGGAERMHINLAPELIKAGYQVTFLMHRAEGAFMESVPEGVRLVALECNRTLSAFWPLVRYLRRERPALLLANFGHSNIIAIAATLLARSDTRVIVTQHNALSREAAAGNGFHYRILPLLYRFFLPFADGISAVSCGVAQEMARMTGCNPDRIRVIYNPVITADFDSRLAAPADHPWLSDSEAPFLLAVGRLTEQKGFDILLQALALLPPMRLIILGEGPLMTTLLEQAHRLGIKDRVNMAGFHANPLAFMRKASLLVMASRYEGFGNVLVEALGCGLNIVSTDCPYGPCEILDQGRFGRLVPPENADLLAKAILYLLKNPLPHEMLRARSRSFIAEASAQHYIRLFKSLNEPTVTDKCVAPAR